MWTIQKEFHFSAAHQLHGLSNSHPCSRLHGHNYVIRVFLSANKLDKVGFVQDYRALDAIKEFIDKRLDHRNLNDYFACNTTVECMSHHIFNLFRKKFPKLKAIEMSETQKTNCRYEPK